MAELVDRIPPSIASAVVRSLFGLPRPAKRLIAGSPIRRDGRELDLDMQLLLRLMRLNQGAELARATNTPAKQRKLLDAGSALVAGPAIPGVGTREVTIPGDDGPIAARLYTPVGLAVGSPLLVYYHGGGFVIGSIDSHANTCRFLATESGARVLSVDYRLAPEYPFPAGVRDAFAAFRFAVDNAESLGADPGAVAVGGDSAGGNLAAVVCSLAAQDGGPRPVFALLIYPGVDDTVRRPSRARFGDIYLTTEAIDWFMYHYLTSEADRSDPRFCLLNCDNLADFPPTMITVGDFDPLSDEGLALGDALAEAGVPVVVHLQPGLIHGFANYLGISSRSRESMTEAVGALRTGFAMATAGKRAVTEEKVG
jgi:acetyl esterase